MFKGKGMEKSKENEKIVSTSWLAEHLEDPSLRIVEVSDMLDPKVYFQGHIPGAVYWPWKESLWHSTAREFVTPEAFAELMRKNGIGHDTTIILYSQSAQFAAYAFWICEMRGHTRTKLLNGNRGLWVREKRPLTGEVPAVKQVPYPLRATDESSRIGREGVLAGLHNPDRVLLDLRSPEEFLGERVIPSSFPVDHGAERKGNIPGAKHLSHVELLDEDERFKPREELQAVFDKREADRAREIVFYCRLSHRASLGRFVARHLLQYSRTKVYDGSWTEWGSIVGFPIENESLSKKK